MKESVAMTGEPIPVGDDTASANNNLSYAQQLRALGQGLEAYKLLTVDLKVEDGFYVVRATARVPKLTESLFGRFLRVFIYDSSSKSRQPRFNSSINLRYSLKDVEELESQGRAKRKESHHMPDPYSLSQVLRGVGFYVDSRDGAHPLEITVWDRWMTLQYQTAEGRLQHARQDVEYFYDYWVKMYLRRKDRPMLPPARDPTLIMEWDDIVKRLRLRPSGFSHFR